MTESRNPLDGKKIIFIGNSYMYFGKMVLMQKDQFVDFDFEHRRHDPGFFYQLCRRRGADVDVTNWTIGSHQLNDLMGDRCTRDYKVCFGTRHLDYLPDRRYDYAVMQVGGCEEEYDWMSWVRRTMDLFRAENPAVRFLYLVGPAAYGINFRYGGRPMASVFAHLPELEALGIRVVDWGRVITDLAFGKVRPEGSPYTYSKNSFIIRRRETDGFHENMLAGYITTLMVYCAITGESPVGLPADFTDDPALNPHFDIDAFRELNYSWGSAEDRATNFPEILRDPRELLALQQLLTRYL